MCVRAKDVAGDYSNWAVIAASFEIDTTPPVAPIMNPLAEGYNAVPISVSWSAVVDGSNAITYELQRADNEAFSGATTAVEVSPFSFTASDGRYWFRVRTVSTVAPGEEKRSA